MAHMLYEQDPKDQILCWCYVILQRTREWGLFLQQVKCSQSNKSSGPWTERTHTHPAEWVRVQYCIITRDFNCYNTVYLLQRSENPSFTWMLFSHCTCSLKQQRVFQETFCFFLIYFSTDLTSDWFQVLLFSSFYSFLLQLFWKHHPPVLEILFSHLIWGIFSI